MLSIKLPLGVYLHPGHLHTMPDIPGEDDTEGRYANYFSIGFNAYEVVIDFGQEFTPSSPRVHTRIVTSAPLAKNLSETLHHSLKEFERKFPLPRKANEGHDPER